MSDNDFANSDDDNVIRQEEDGQVQDETESSNQIETKIASEGEQQNSPRNSSHDEPEDSKKDTFSESEQVSSLQVEAGANEEDKVADEEDSKNVVDSESVPQVDSKEVEDKPVDGLAMEFEEEEEEGIIKEDSIEDGQMLDLNAEFEQSSANEMEKSKMEWIQVVGLTRPFSLPSLKRHLESAGGNLIQDSFWINGVKSICCVRFENHADVYSKVISELHDKNWPESNPKRLQVTAISTQEQLAIVRREDEPTSDNENSQYQRRHSTSRTRNSRSRSPPRRRRSRSRSPISKEPSPQPKYTQEQLDKLFRKTTAKPVLYYRPLTDEEIETRNP